MSRRSKRLGSAAEYHQEEDDRVSNSSVDSHVLYTESLGRSSRRKVISAKRASPIPQTTQHTYYSKTSTYVNRDRGDVSSAYRETDYGGSHWGDDGLVRKGRVADLAFSSATNGLSEPQPTYDRSTSSSGYSSEEDYTGRCHSDGSVACGSRWGRLVSRVGKLSSLLLSFPGRAFGLLYWWFGTTWYRLITLASLLDVFILTRHYSVLKRPLLILLLLLLLALVATGLWYLYPYGLPALSSAPVAFLFGAWKPVGGDTLRKVGQGPQASSLSSQTELISRMESLESRFQDMEKGLTQLHMGETSMTEEARGAEGAGLSRKEVVQVFTELSSQREVALREGILQEGATRSQNDLKTLREEQHGNLQQIQQKLHRMSMDVEGQILQLRTDNESPPWDQVKEDLIKEVVRLEEQLSGLRQELAAVRDTQADVSQQVAAVPGQIRGVRDEVQSMFPAWLLAQSDPVSGGRPGTLSELFLRRDELQRHLLDLERKILSGVSAERKQWVSQAHSTIGGELQAGGFAGVTHEEVHDIVNKALQRYSEDRIGLVDYALESSGASVLNTRCSETYETKTALLSLFGIPLWYQSQSPRVILQPDSNPGNCWAFRGSQGFAVIRLSSRIRPTAVTLDHISRSLSPKATISSAPKDFSVYGLEEETQKEGRLLGRFSYDQHGDPIQTFHIQEEDVSSYQLVELRVDNNWGHPEYTCIYRFRVHGETDM